MRQQILAAFLAAWTTTAAMPAWAGESAPTDFGERILPQTGVRPLTLRPFTAAVPSMPRHFSAGGSRSLAEAVALLRGWGRVTSTFRSFEHNRAVGGVPNSYHLRGRAIDLVRAPGVRHAQLDAMIRAAGFHLVESLDEQDHSHFALAWRGEGPTTSVPLAAAGATMPAQAKADALPAGVTWKWVYAPGVRR